MDHKELAAWQKSIDLVEGIYKLTRLFPKEEVYGLISQMRRAAVSIPSNIAEGAARNSDKEFVNFLHYALGSVAELETQVTIAQRLAYIDSSQTPSLLNEVRSLICGLIRHLRSK